MTDRFGSKPTWIACIALFALGSGLCALATSAGELIAFRVLQGLGSGMLMPVGFTLIAQSAGPHRVGRALALVGVPILLGPIFGPIRSPGFRAAASTTFLLGAALFGTLLILPLYYQVDRGENALSAGLLLAPQGIGAALMLPISGRLTDRIGGGPVVIAGCSLIALATLPFMFISDHTPYGLLGGVLFVRGLGLGASIQPATAAAYALLESAQIPLATAALNTLRQVGGSIGTALLAVILQHQSAAAVPSAGGRGLLAPLPAGERAQISGPLATAFADTFRWALVRAVVAILPSLALLRAERARRRAERKEPSMTAGSTGVRPTMAAPER